MLPFCMEVYTENIIKIIFKENTIETFLINFEPFSLKVQQLYEYTFIHPVPHILILVLRYDRFRFLE